MSSVKQAERLQEDWVKFLRIYCKEGYIDHWMGDCINDPNNEKINAWQLNSFATYYRLGEGKWINNRSFKGEIRDNPLLTNTKELFTAEEIWEASYEKEE